MKTEVFSTIPLVINLKKKMINEWEACCHCFKLITFRFTKKKRWPKLHLYWQHGYLLTSIFTAIWWFFGFLDLFIYTFFRWDLSLIDNLPDYMKIALEIFFKTCNELIVEVLKEQGRDMTAYIRKNAVCTVNYEEHFVQNHQIHKTIKT